MLVRSACSKMAGLELSGWPPLLGMLAFVRDLVLTLLAVLIVAVVVREGPAGLARRLLSAAKLLPGAEWMISAALRREVRGFVRQVQKGERSDHKGGKTLAIPQKGLSHQELYEELKKRKKAEIDPHTGKIFAYVYTSEDARFRIIQKAFDMFEFEEEDDDGTQTDSSSSKPTIQKEAIVQLFFHAFMHENALNPLVFPGLKQFETEVVAMVANMLHGDERVVGSMTSGGTESILMAMKSYRDRARHLFPHIKHPEIVAPRTIHPAFEKAASYFDLTIVHVPLKPDYTVDMKAYRKAITPRTILLVVSAPEYCYGIVDPVEEVSQIAVECGLPMHVDSCIGGFMLPWVEKLGYSVPVFDFCLPGVTSMSADIHKYGLGTKGASVVLYRSAELRRYQIFAYAEWPGGLFGSPSMAGSRPGGNIASSWAVLNSMGQEGYMDVAKRLMEVTKHLKEGVNSIQGLHICGQPHMTIITIGSSDPKLDVFAVADLMETKGWKMERQLETLHCTVLPSHSVETAGQFVQDLRSACETARANPSLSKKGSAGMYGMVAMIPDKAIVKDFITEFFNEVYTL